jgi:hypothetical protein
MPVIHAFSSAMHHLTVSASGVPVSTPANLTLAAAKDKSNMSNAPEGLGTRLGMGECPFLFLFLAAHCDAVDTFLRHEVL